ncbi:MULTISPECIES: hypothetical protein [unclassified Massilia]|uniref:hypothetical protein n=1 Tax=unclassified Massilia TaxID=2609279 RepID=UPI0017861818|nr:MULTISPECIES: hypothetical protein [unclassified Massilia]MBD8531537.1 hypothetical protein [Massilia sp. CFBP 13647]MBD8673667.1 hypothetical protein [Massilia sp. CFBP 13721]
MKERPILFSAPMVRALLDGSKTQTRRVVKQLDPAEGVCVTQADGKPLNGCCWRYGSPVIYCPYGQPGDRLWVRETWLEDPEDDGTWHYTQYMGCKGSPLSEIPRKFQKPEHCIFRADWTGSDLVWRPSIHMPRWASRILLEVVSVRVERLQDCSESDAIAEGAVHIRSQAWDREHFPAWRFLFDEAVSAGAKPPIGPSPVQAYQALWESINGAGSWDANPWVWVVEFKRVAP